MRFFSKELRVCVFVLSLLFNFQGSSVALGDLSILPHLVPFVKPFFAFFESFFIYFFALKTNPFPHHCFQKIYTLFI